MIPHDIAGNDRTGQSGDYMVTDPPQSKALSADQLFAEAAALHRTGKLSAAAEKYHAALERCPDYADALHLLGVIALQTGDTPRALVLIDQAIAADPKPAN